MSWSSKEQANQINELLAAPYVLFDVDGVLVDYKQQCRQGTVDIARGFRELGFAIRIWSAAGWKYANETALSIDFPFPALFYTKPDYPIQEKAALTLLGKPPVLQFDDDVTEHVADWPFVHLPCDGPAFKRGPIVLQGPVVDTLKGYTPIGYPFEGQVVEGQV